MTRTLSPRRALRAVAGLATVGVVLAGGLALAPAASAASCSAGYVALTFDDGPTAATTSQIVSTLRQYGASATVFPTGQNAQNNSSLMQTYKNAGLQIGNHSWDHPHLVNMSESDVRSQLSRTQQVVQQTAGVTPQVFRPPYGEVNQTVRSVASSLGLTVVTWDVDSADWNNASASAIRQAAQRLQPGQVILMHDWPGATVQALPGILQDLQARNLCAGQISPTTGRAVAPLTGTPGGGDNGGGNNGGGNTGGGDSGSNTNNGCIVSWTRGESWGDRFNVTYTVTGRSNWSVTVYPNTGQSIQSAWGANRSGNTFTPNGSNSFGVTYYKGSQNISYIPWGICS